MFLVINPLTFSSELATTPPTISSTKQRPHVIASTNFISTKVALSTTYTEDQLSTIQGLTEERGQKKQKRQSDEEGIVSQSFRTLIIFCSIPGSLYSLTPSPITSYLIPWDRRGPENDALVVTRDLWASTLCRNIQIIREKTKNLETNHSKSDFRPK